MVEQTNPHSGVSRESVPLVFRSVFAFTPGTLPSQLCDILYICFFFVENSLTVQTFFPVPSRPFSLPFVRTALQLLEHKCGC